MTRVVVDADYIVYACGFAVEKTLYDVSVIRPDGTTDETIVNSRDEVNAWLSDESVDSVRQVDKMVDAEPLANALFLVNRTLSSIDQKVTEAGIEFDKLELYITGKGNFREGLATIKGYKANRDPSHRPVHYKSIRRYLKNRWGATEVSGYEADDAVAMIAAQYEYDPARIVIVSVDKDLRTIPGYHYNFKTRKFSLVSHDEARANFYRQLITGDTTDNIGGAFKSGEKMASKIQPEWSESFMYDYALTMYEKGRNYSKCPYAHMSAAEALLENARLLHLQRYENDVWVPPAERRDSPVSSTVPNSSKDSGPPLTSSASSTGTKPSRTKSRSPEQVDAFPAEAGKSSETPCTPPTSSSTSGPSRRKGSSRRKTAKGSSPS